MREALEYARDGYEELAVKVGSGLDSWGIHGEIHHRLAAIRAVLSDHPEGPMFRVGDHLTIEGEPFVIAADPPGDWYLDHPKEPTDA